MSEVTNTIKCVTRLNERNYDARLLIIYVRFVHGHLRQFSVCIKNPNADEGTCERAEAEERKLGMYTCEGWW